LEFRLWEFKKSSHLLDFSPREFVRENSWGSKLRSSRILRISQPPPYSPPTIGWG
jgi:hypothetical protein